jgi:hypothetical protein
VPFAPTLPSPYSAPPTSTPPTCGAANRSRSKPRHSR